MTASLRATAVLARREPIFALSFSPQVRSEFSYRTLVISALAVPRRAESPWLFTVVVGGAGLTGIEAATEMPEKTPGDAGTGQPEPTVPRHPRRP